MPAMIVTARTDGKYLIFHLLMDVWRGTGSMMPKILPTQMYGKSHIHLVLPFSGTVFMNHC